MCACARFQGKQIWAGTGQCLCPLCWLRQNQGQPNWEKWGSFFFFEDLNQHPTLDSLYDCVCLNHNSLWKAFFYENPLNYGNFHAQNKEEKVSKIIYLESMLKFWCLNSYLPNFGKDFLKLCPNKFLKIKLSS